MSNRLVAPTLTFVVFPDKKKSGLFEKSETFGYNNFAGYGSYKPYNKNNTHLIEVNQFVISQNIPMILSGDIVYGFYLNIGLSKWYSSRIRKASVMKIHIGTSFGEFNGDNYYGNFNMEITYIFDYDKYVGKTIFNEDAKLPHHILSFSDHNHLINSIDNAPLNNLLVKMHRYFYCLTYMNAPCLVNIQFLEWYGLGGNN